MIIKTLEPLSEINLKKIEDATGIKPEYVSRENISDETLGCADVIITRDRDFKSEVLEKCHNLKFLFVVSAGVEKLPFDLLKEKIGICSSVYSCKKIFNKKRDEENTK